MRFLSLMRLSGYTAGIYKIHNTVTGRFYIGQSKDIQKRFQQHLHSLSKGEHISKLMQYDYKLFGEVSMKLTVIEDTDDPRELFFREAYWIGVLRPEYNANNLYNEIMEGETTRNYLTENFPPLPVNSHKKPVNTGVSAQELLDIINSKPEILAGILKKNLTIREVARLTGASVPTTGRVIKKLREQ